MKLQQQNSMPEVAGPRISRGDVITQLKLSGAWHQAKAQLEGDALVGQIAQKEKLTVADPELQQEFDAFRVSRGLHKAEDTQNWLKSADLTVEQVEHSLESAVLAGKLAERLVNGQQIEKYYSENPTAFDYARVSQIVVSDQGKAEEIALSAREEGEDFAKLAKQHSQDQGTKCGGGFCGMVTREDTKGFPQALADRIFAGSPGEVIGPCQLGGAFYLVKVEENGRLPLDEGLRSTLRNQLFGKWLAERAGATPAAPAPA